MRCDAEQPARRLLLARASFAGALAAAIAGGAAVSAVAGDEARAFPVGEKPLVGSLASIDGEGNMSLLVAGKLRVLAPADLAYWGRYRDTAAGPLVVLRDGGVLRADVLLCDEQKIVVGDALGLGRGLWGESSLPRAAVAAVIFQPPAAPAERDRLPAAVLTGSPTGDRLLLVGGDALAGTLMTAPRLGRFAASDADPASDAFQLLRRAGSQPLSIPSSKVVAVAFQSPADTAPLPARGALWLGFSDGSLLAIKPRPPSTDQAFLQLTAGGALTFNHRGADAPAALWRAITYVEPVNPRVAWLSDQPTLGYKHLPLLSVARDFGLDRTPLGTRLRVEDAVVRKGLGMPSAARLAYDTAGYRRFEAELAVDAAAGLAGSIVGKVLLEAAPGKWQTAYESPILRGGEAPLPISIELNGAARLALLVEYADRGDSCDHADWLHARLTR